MILPNAGEAYVPRSKLTEYLLSINHPVGRAKAAVLLSHGFHAGNVDKLEEGLLTIARSQTVIGVVESLFGEKYAIDGTLHTPDGRQLAIRTIWIIERDKYTPRFVTAYPR